MAIDDDTIRALREEAIEAGDTQQVRICDFALMGNDVFRRECERVILAAASQHME